VLQPLGDLGDMPGKLRIEAAASVLGDAAASSDTPRMKSMVGRPRPRGSGQARAGFNVFGGRPPSCRSAKRATREAAGLRSRTGLAKSQISGISNVPVSPMMRNR
jgi:hypothetical protein